MEAGCSKIKEFYEKTAESHVYTFALRESDATCLYNLIMQVLTFCDISPVLDPSSKTDHVRKYWGKDLLADVLTEAEEMV